jgi:hypothetical protein
MAGRMPAGRIMASAGPATPGMPARRMARGAMGERPMPRGARPGAEMATASVLPRRAARVPRRRVMARVVMAGGNVVGMIHVMRIPALALVIREVRAAVGMTVVPVAMTLVPSLAAPPAVVPVVTPPRAAGPPARATAS